MSQFEEQAAPISWRGLLCFLGSHKLLWLTPMLVTFVWLAVMLVFSGEPAPEIEYRLF